MNLSSLPPILSKNNNYFGQYSRADRILILKDGELVADDEPKKLVESVQGGNLEDVYMNYFGDMSQG